MGSIRAFILLDQSIKIHLSHHLAHLFLEVTLNLQIIWMHTASGSMHWYPTNAKTMSVPYDQALKCKPEKFSLGK